MADIFAMQAIATLETAVGWAQIVTATVTTAYVILTFGLLLATARSTRASAALAKAAVAPATAISVAVHSDHAGVYVQWTVDSWDTVRLYVRPRRTDFGTWAPLGGLMLEPRRDGPTKGVVVYRPHDEVDHHLSIRVHRAGSRIGSTGKVTLVRSGTAPALVVGNEILRLNEPADVPTHMRTDTVRRQPGSR